MSASQPTFCFHRRYGYYFRMRIPADLYQWFERTEIRYSLRISVLTESKSRARLLAGRIQALFKIIRDSSTDTTGYPEAA